MNDQTYLTVVKSNKVIEASFLLSLVEQRVLLAGIAQIDSTAELSEKYQFEISVTEIADLVGLDNFTNTYRDLKKAAKQLYNRTLIIENPNPNIPSIKQREIRWISGIDYIPDEGKLVLSFSNTIIPYLSCLSKEFTKYKLMHVAKFDSVYSIRLYELLVQWQSVGKREIEVEWLKKQFQVGDKYKRLGDLKKRVINPAIAEINQHSNLWVQYGQRKAGRIITHFQFEFGLKGQEKKPQKIAHEKHYLGIAQSIIEKQARPGETYIGTATRLKKKG